MQCCVLFIKTSFLKNLKININVHSFLDEFSSVSISAPISVHPKLRLKDNSLFLKTWQLYSYSGNSPCFVGGGGDLKCVFPEIKIEYYYNVFVELL